MADRLKEDRVRKSGSHSVMGQVGFGVCRASVTAVQVRRAPDDPPVGRHRGCDNRRGGGKKKEESRLPSFGHTLPNSFSMIRPVLRHLFFRVIITPICHQHVPTRTCSGNVSLERLMPPTVLLDPSLPSKK